MSTNPAIMTVMLIGSIAAAAKPLDTKDFTGMRIMKDQALVAMGTWRSEYKHVSTQAILDDRKNTHPILRAGRYKPGCANSAHGAEAGDSFC